MIALVAALFGIVVGPDPDAGRAAPPTPAPPKMREIAAAIQEGAEAFLRRQFRAIAIIVVPLAVLIFFTATKVIDGPNGIGGPLLRLGRVFRVALLPGRAPPSRGSPASSA